MLKEKEKEEENTRRVNQNLENEVQDIAATPSNNNEILLLESDRKSLQTNYASKEKMIPIKPMLYDTNGGSFATPDPVETIDMENGI